MKNKINMLAIDKNDYVDYEIGGVLPSGLTYVEGQGLIVFGQGTGTLKKRVVINPDALKSTATEVNLFDAEKGELNPDLYEQMALPDGMTYNKNDGLVLTGLGENAKSLTINPNNVSKNTQLIDVDTNKIDASLSTLPTGLTYSQSTGLEIEGDTTTKSLVIDPNGFSTKTPLFKTRSPKINEDLYDAGGDSRLPEWVHFNELSRTMTIEGYRKMEGEEPLYLHLNAGSLKKGSVYIINTETGYLRGELPDKMDFDPAVGLILENNSGGRIVIPSGDGYIKDTQTLFRTTNFIPNMNPDENPPVSDYYMACNVPTYLTIVGTQNATHLGYGGFFHNSDNNNYQGVTSIGGSSMNMWKVVKNIPAPIDVIVIDEDGLSPNGIKSGIDASKITTGTLKAPVEITSENNFKRVSITSDGIKLQCQYTDEHVQGYYDSLVIENDSLPSSDHYDVSMKIFDLENGNPSLQMYMGTTQILTGDGFVMTPNVFRYYFNNGKNYWTINEEGLHLKINSSDLVLHDGAYSVSVDNKNKVLVDKDKISITTGEATLQVVDDEISYDFLNSQWRTFRVKDSGLYIGNKRNYSFSIDDGGIQLATSIDTLTLDSSGFIFKNVNNNSPLTINSDGLVLTGTKSVFKVYPSGNVSVSKINDNNYRSQMTCNNIEIVYNQKDIFRATGYDGGTLTLINMKPGGGLGNVQHLSASGSDVKCYQDNNAYPESLT